MPNTIIIKQSSTVSDVPTAGQMVTGELAVNVTDQKLYSKDATTVFKIGVYAADAETITGVWDFTTAPSQHRFGVGGDYSSTGGASTWGATIWSIDTTWKGATAGVDSASTSVYGIRWLRNLHTEAHAQVSEGLYGFKAGAMLWGLGEVGMAIFNGDKISAYGPSNIKVIQMRHDGTDAYFNLSTATGDLNFTGAINYDFDSSVHIDVKDDSGALGLYLQNSTGTEALSITATGALVFDFDFVNTNQVNFNGGSKYDFSNETIQSVGELYLTEQAAAAGNISNQFQLWVRNSSPNILFGTTGDGDEFPIGYNSMPPVAISASQNMLLAQVGYMLHKSSGVAITLTCAQDTNTWDGATWGMHNDDTEDVTIAAGASVTVYWLEAGSAPAAGSVIVKQGGIVSIYKRSNTEFWVWGAKDASAGGIADIVEDTTPQLGGDLQSNTFDIDMADNDSIYFGAGNDGRIYSNGTDLYIDLAVTGDFRLRGGSANDTMITAFTNSFVQLAYDGTVKFSTASGGANVIGVLTADGLDMEDNHHILLGIGDDVDMYFDATDFYIDMIDGADFRLRGGTGGTENMIVATANSNVALYHNAGLEFRTQQHEGSSITSGAECYDHAGNLRDVGFNHVVPILIAASDTLENIHAGSMLLKVNAGTYVITLAASTTEFPVGSMCTILNHGTGGSLTISDGAENMFIMDGSGTVVNHAGFVLAVAGAITIWRESTDDYYVWGTGIP